MALTSLLQSEATTLAEVAAHLDALDSDGRVQEIRDMPGKLQERVWRLAAEAAPFTLEDLVPPGETGQVVLAGKNSLPMFAWFEKRFARVAGKVIGHNHQQMSWFTGPGYFTCVAAPQAERRKEVLLDYTQVPSEKLGEWPPIKANEAGFSRFVYKGLRDYLRRVSRDVVIGEATRRDKPMNNWFMIARR
jgi:hypothetical protein